MSIEKPDDIVTKSIDLSQTRVGHILDAQDYFQQWYLAIVIDREDGESNAAFSPAIDTSSSKANIKRKLHFLPFGKNSKRDETFNAQEYQHKIAPAFTNSEKQADPIKAVVTLRDYLKLYQQ
jgi:hypothetical protein